MWMHPNAPIGNMRRVKLKSPVRYESLNQQSAKLRKMGFTGLAIDDIGDQRFLIHASSYWLKLSKNENGEWSGAALFGN